MKKILLNDFKVNLWFKHKSGLEMFVTLDISQRQAAEEMGRPVWEG